MVPTAYNLPPKCKTKYFKHMNKKQATLFSINFIQTKLHMTNYHLELRGT